MTKTARTPEQRAAQSERMKSRWAGIKAQAQKENPDKFPQPPSPPSLPNVMETSNAASENLARIPEIHTAMENTSFEARKPVPSNPRMTDMCVDWKTIPLEDANYLIGHLSNLFQEAAKVVQARMWDRDHKLLQCYVCDAKIEDGRWCYADLNFVENPTVSSMKRAVYLCSQPCYSNFMIKRGENRRAIVEAAAKANAGR